MSDEQGRIVVGVDGSPSSLAALRWAIKQAEMTGASVEAVTAWRNTPALAMAAPFTEADVNSPDAGIKEAAERMLRESVNAAAGSSTVAVKAEIGEGSAAQLLLSASEGASLVVVGSRGHGGFTGALLGSVGQALAQHAACPVLIYRGTA